MTTFTRYAPGRRTSGATGAAGLRNRRIGAGGR
jgi:hypothetical protein